MNFDQKQLNTIKSLTTAELQEFLRDLLDNHHERLDQNMRMAKYPRSSKEAAAILNSLTKSTVEFLEKWRLL